MKRWVFSLLLLCLILGGVPGAAYAEPAQAAMVNTAGTMLDGILLGLNQEDYTLFSRDFDQAMKKAMPEPAFKKMSKDIKAKIGIFLSKEFVTADQKDGYQIVEYRGNCTREDAVAIRLVVSEADGKWLVSGFWLDSPKLRQP